MAPAGAPLHNLSSRLTKQRHCLHNATLQCEQLRADCDKAKAQVEANDGELEKMTAEEQEAQPTRITAESDHRRTARGMRGTNKKQKKKTYFVEYDDHSMRAIASLVLSAGLLVLVVSTMHCCRPVHLL